ncbi:MAG: hypothetical protein GXY15_02740, partial [Candidatus Hydrogenedentes bacterium]|nr:hypothetical protein [Candidatus Hydrogenedentota bacterium]
IAAVAVSLLDTDGNGGLSLAEIEAVYPDMEAAYFTLLDGNRDGRITAAELAVIATILPIDSYIGMVDPNGDGLIAYAEVSQYLSQSQFDVIDTNSNGVIDCVDVAALTGGVIPGEGEGEGEDPVEGEGEPVGPCPIDFSDILQTLAPVVVSLLDANGDGGVSLAEIQAVYPDMEAVYFTLLDANRDGKITASELSAIVGILPVGSFLGMIDPNGDGLIAYAEVSQYLSQSQFNLLDTNNNGVIDCDDIAALTGGVIPGEGEPEGEPGGPCPVLDALDIPAILGYVVPLLDRDGDGGLSLAEIQAVYADLEPMYFSLVDLNHDGVVTAAELGTLVNILPLDQLLGGIDPNGDGVFSYDEVSEYLPEALFDFLDANANGVIDCEDVAALLAGGGIPFEGEGEDPVDPDVCPIPPLSPVLAEVALALVDADGDGGVSLAEVQAVYAAFEPSWFSLVDANNDGLVNASELLRISGALPLDDLLGFVDANGNRVIEYAEVAAFVTPEQFAGVDVNGDGVLDCHDVAALIPGEGEPEGEEGEGEPGEGEGEPGEGEPPVDPDICPIPLEENLLLRTLLILFDGNGDGVISPAELGTLGVPPAVFAQFDGNGDGVLDLVELRRALRAAQALGVMQADLNGNGALEYAEVSAYVTPAQFALVDVNADGVFDCRDFEGISPVEGEPEGEEGEGEPGEGEGEGEPGTPEDWLLRLLERLRASGNLAALIQEAFALLDTNLDGALSHDEITARFALPRQVFAVLDTNRDGLITPDEIEAFVGAVPPVQPVQVELTRMMSGRFFTPGEPVTVTVRLVKRGPGLLASLNLLEVLPAGWTITNVLSTAGGAATKADGVNNALALTWAGTMPFPIEVVYEALPAADAPRIGAFAGQADYTAASGQAFSTGVIPTVVARALPPEQAHTADTNRDWRISLAELLRVVQLYNAGGYRDADGTEDGFAPGPGPLGALLHSADVDGDGNISISELLRTIQLFNAPDGAYYADEGTEDGFVPGVY